MHKNPIDVNQPDQPDLQEFISYLGQIRKRKYAVTMGLLKVEFKKNIQLIDGVDIIVSPLNSIA